MKNPNLQKNADYQFGIWTKISKFSNFKSDFFPLKDMTLQKHEMGAHLYYLSFIWQKIWEKSENFSFDQKSPTFLKLKFDFFPIKKVLRKTAKLGKFSSFELFMSEF